MKEILKEDFIKIMIKSFLNFDNLTIGEIKINDLKNENNNIYIKILIDDVKPKNKEIKFLFNGVEYSCIVDLEKSNSYLKIININDIKTKISKDEFSIEPLYVNLKSSKSTNVIYAKLKKISLTYTILKIHKIHVEEVLHYHNSVLNIPNIGDFHVTNQLIKINEDYIEIKSSFNEMSDNLKEIFLEHFYFSRQHSKLEDISFNV